MAQKTRTELQELFQTGAKPSQQDFTDFIESTLNRKDDGIEKPSGEGTPLKITAQGDDEKLLDFYRSETKTWSISQKSGNQEGLNISNSSGESKLFIDSSSGNVGIGTDNPGATLDVAGALKFSGTGTLIFHNTNPSGTPTVSDGFRVRYDHDFFAQSSDALVIEKVDFNGDIPDGGIAFVNTGQNGTPQTALVIRGDGNVGIGTDAPDAQLTVNGNIKSSSLNVTENTTLDGDLTVEGSLSVSNNTFNDWDINLSGHVRLRENGTNKLAYLQARDDDSDRDIGLRIRTQQQGTVVDALTIAPNGNVGIGTTSPGGKLCINGGLHIGGDSNPGDNNLQVDGNTTTNGLSVSGNLYFGELRRQMIGLWGNDYGIGIQTHTQYFRSHENFAWYKGGGHDDDELNPGGGTVQMVINNTNVGIGTASPGAKLHISHTGSGDILRIDDPTNESSPFIINEHGSVGIGTDAPGAKLDVAGSLKLSGTETLMFHSTNESGTPIGDGFRFRYDTDFFGTSNDALVIEKTDFNNPTPDGGIAFVNTGQNGTVEEALVIRGNGNVGIGTTSPGGKLCINGGLHIGGDSNPGDNNLQVDGNTTTNGLSVSGNLDFGELRRQMIGLWRNDYGIGIQTHTQYFRSHENFAWYKGGEHDDDELNPGGGTVQMVINNTNVGIGTATPGEKLEVNGTIKAKGLKITDTKPIQVKKFTISPASSTDTGYSTTDWICGVIGFLSGSGGDISEGGSKTIIQVYAFANGSKWHLKADFRTDSDTGSKSESSWRVWLIAIRKDIVKAANDL